MLIDDRSAGFGQIQDLTGIDHCSREMILFLLVQSADEHGHQQGRDLIVGPCTVTNAVDKDVDLVCRERPAVALLFNYFLGSHFRKTDIRNNASLKTKMLSKFRT